MDFAGVDVDEKKKDKDYWEPIRALKKRLREFERRSSSSVDMFEGWKSGELMEKVKSSLVCFFLSLSVASSN